MNDLEAIARFHCGSSPQQAGQDFPIALDSDSILW